MAERRRWRRPIAMVAAATFVAATSLFAWTVHSDVWRVPERGETSAQPVREKPDSIRVLAWNLEKGRRPEGDEFAQPPDDMEDVLHRMAGVIQETRADVVLLSEVRLGCDPCPMDQPAYLAEVSGMYAWAYGISYRWGLPFYKVQNGIAILSRFPFDVVEIATLPGARPVYAPAKNRRILWVDLRIGDRTVRAAPIWLESYDAAINLRQVESILEVLGPEGALLGGDFNATPDSDSMLRLRDSGRFVGDFEARAPTFPAWKPERRIDYILGPRRWKHRSTLVLDIGDLSDHRAIVTEFNLEDW